MTPPSACDVLIIGGGAVGMALLLQLREQGRDAWLVEARHAPHLSPGRPPAGESPQPAADPRALALSSGSQQLLASLDCWPGACATPIHTVMVNQQGSFGRLRLTREELGLPALGYVLGLAELMPGLWQRAEGQGLLAGWRAANLRATGHYAAVDLQQQTHTHTVTCRLLVLADGGASSASLVERSPVSKDYGQVAILARVQASHPQPFTAFERFADDGPIAVLPQREGYAVVWTQSGDAVQQRLQESDEQFCEELSQRLGGRLGRLQVQGQRHRYPLRLLVHQRLPLPRVVTLGNAAQALHPIAGQGLNLGLRDSQVLAQLLQGAHDSGEASVLSRYRQLRRWDQMQTVGFTDALVEGFRISGSLARHARSLGLAAVDMLPLPRQLLLNNLVFGRR